MNVDDIDRVIDVSAQLRIDISHTLHGISVIYDS